MTAADRKKKPEIVPTDVYLSQPKIWVDGRQKPRFDFSAYRSVSLAIARRDLKPEMVDAAQRLQHFGQSVAAGERRVNLARLGRVARLVPSHQWVGRRLLSLGRLFAEAGDLVLPPPAPEEPIAYPNLIRPSFAKQPVVPQRPTPQPKPVRDEPTLHAIRSAIGTPSHRFEHEMPPPSEAAVDEATDAASPGMLRRGMGWTLAAICLTFALPAGAIRALMFHLDGGDLRDWF